MRQEVDGSSKIVIHRSPNEEFRAFRVDGGEVQEYAGKEMRGCQKFCGVNLMPLTGIREAGKEAGGVFVPEAGEGVIPRLGYEWRSRLLSTAPGDCGCPSYP